MKKRIFSSALKVSLVGLSLWSSVAYAWTAPTVVPPGGNVATPINTSGVSQYKGDPVTHTGGFGIEGLIRGYSNAIFDGNLGVGTPNPQAKLDVVGQAQINSTTPAWNGWNNTINFSNPYHAALVYPAGGLLFGMHSDTNFYWANTRSGSYTMTLGNTGNLWTPGNISSSGTISATGDVCSGTKCLSNVGGINPPAGASFVDTSATAQTKTGSLTAGGINSTGSIKSYSGFVGDATANIGGTGAAGYFPNGLWSNGVNAWLYGAIHTNGQILDTASRMSLNPAGNSWFNGGNLGVGTPNPQAKLDVVGNISATGDVCSGAKCLSTVGGVNPPAGASFVDTSATVQTKTGDLTVNKISATTHCIGTDCRTAWPTGGDNLGNHTATQALNMGTNNIIGGGANSWWGALTIQGSKNSMSGLNFKDAVGANSGTLAMGPLFSAIYNSADNGFRWYVDDVGNTIQNGNLSASGLSVGRLLYPYTSNSFAIVSGLQTPRCGCDTTTNGGVDCGFPSFTGTTDYGPTCYDQTIYLGSPWSYQYTRGAIINRSVNIINGSLNITPVSGAGQVLTSDTNGNASWQYSGVGMGQSWQDMTGSAVGCASARAHDVVCTNNTGRPIQMNANFFSYGVIGEDLFVGIPPTYVKVSHCLTNSNSPDCSVVGIIPTGASYYIGSALNPVFWSELR